MKKNTTKKQQKDNKEINNNERIIKRNWWRIGIIVTIIVVILIGLSVGLYFLFRPTYDLNTERLIVTTSKKVGEEVRSPSQDKKDGIGVFFYQEDEQTTNWLLWNDQEGKDGDNKGIGPLSELIDNSKRTWYGINLDKEDSREIIDNIFVNNDTLDFYEQFMGLNPSTGKLTGGFNFYDQLTAGDDLQDEELITYPDYSVVKDEDDEDYGYTISGDFTIKPGEVMFFNGENGYIENVVESYTIPDQSSDTATEDRDAIHDYLVYFDSVWTFST